MKFLKMLYDITNGKKTKAGVVISVLTVVLSLFGYGDLTPGIEGLGEYLQRPESQAFIAGLITILGGLFDKWRKARKNGN